VVHRNEERLAIIHMCIVLVFKQIRSELFVFTVSLS